MPTVYRIFQIPFQVFQHSLRFFRMRQNKVSLIQLTCGLKNNGHLLYRIHFAGLFLSQIHEEASVTQPWDHRKNTRTFLSQDRNFASVRTLRDMQNSQITWSRLLQMCHVMRDSTASEYEGSRRQSEVWPILEPDQLEQDEVFPIMLPPSHLRHARKRSQSLPLPDRALAPSSRQLSLMARQEAIIKEQPSQTIVPRHARKRSQSLPNNEPRCSAVSSAGSSPRDSSPSTPRSPHSGPHSPHSPQSLRTSGGGRESGQRDSDTLSPGGTALNRRTAFSVRLQLDPPHLHNSRQQGSKLPLNRLAPSLAKNAFGYTTRPYAWCEACEEFEGTPCPWDSSIHFHAVPKPAEEPAWKQLSPDSKLSKALLASAESDDAVSHKQDQDVWPILEPHQLQQDEVFPVPSWSEHENNFPVSKWKQEEKKRRSSRSAPTSPEQNPRRISLALLQRKGPACGPSQQPPRSQLKRASTFSVGLLSAQARRRMSSQSTRDSEAERNGKLGAHSPVRKASSPYADYPGNNEYRNSASSETDWGRASTAYSPSPNFSRSNSTARRISLGLFSYSYVSRPSSNPGSTRASTVSNGFSAFASNFPSPTDSLVSLPPDRKALLENNRDSLPLPNLDTDMSKQCGALVTSVSSQPGAPSAIGPNLLPNLDVITHVDDQPFSHLYVLASFLSQPGCHWLRIRRAGGERTFNLLVSATSTSRPCPSPKVSPKMQNHSNLAVGEEYLEDFPPKESPTPTDKGSARTSPSHATSRISPSNTTTMQPSTSPGSSPNARKSKLSRISCSFRYLFQRPSLPHASSRDRTRSSTDRISRTRSSTDRARSSTDRMSRTRSSTDRARSPTRPVLRTFPYRSFRTSSGSRKGSTDNTAGYSPHGLATMSHGTLPQLSTKPDLQLPDSSRSLPTTKRTLEQPKEIELIQALCPPSLEQKAELLERTLRAAKAAIRGKHLEATEELLLEAYGVDSANHDVRKLLETHVHPTKLPWNISLDSPSYMHLPHHIRLACKQVPLTHSGPVSFEPADFDLEQGAEDELVKQPDKNAAFLPRDTLSSPGSVLFASESSPQIGLSEPVLYTETEAGLEI
eukprot:g52619.t1